MGPRSSRSTTLPVLHACADTLGLDRPDPHRYHALPKPQAVFPDALPVLPVPLAEAPVPGKPNPANAKAVVASIEQATKLALTGQAGAVVTNPINKAALYQAGFSYPGHTEFLAASDRRHRAADHDAGQPDAAGGAGHRACLAA